MFIYIYIPICFLPDVPLLLPAGLCTLQQLASFYPVSTLAGPPMELLPASAVALCFAYFHHSPVAGSREVYIYIYIYVCVVENAIPGTLQMQHDETGSMGAMSQTHTHTHSTCLEHEHDSPARVAEARQRQLELQPRFARAHVKGATCLRGDIPNNACKEHWRASSKVTALLQCAGPLHQSAQMYVFHPQLTVSRNRANAQSVALLLPPLLQQHCFQSWNPSEAMESWL